MCLPQKPQIPNVQPGAPTPAPAQPAASLNQANPFNSGLNSNVAAAAQRNGVAGLTIPLIARPPLGGAGPTGLGIPVS